MSEAEGRVLYAGAGLALAILAVGPASHEIVRHLIQAAPLMILCVVGARRPELLRWLLAPIFAFWLLIAVLIWLFLLHLARVITGTFSPLETALTGAMAAAVVYGLSSFPAVRRRARLWPGLGVSLLALGLQIAAFAVSLQPWVAQADGHEVASAASANDLA